MRRVRGNDEFAKWWDRWTKRLQRNRAAIKTAQPEREHPAKPDYPNSFSGPDLKRCTSKPYDKAS